MYSYDYDIVNEALIQLGANTISSLTENTRVAQLAQKIYNETREQVLRVFPWPFATRRGRLAPYEANVITITDVTQQDPGVVSFTGELPNNGDIYYFEDVGGMTELNGNYYMVWHMTDCVDKFELYDTDGNPVDTQSYSAYTSGGQATEQVPRTDDWSYIYELPEDCLRVLEINDNPEAEFFIEEKGLYTNESPCEIRYITRVTYVPAYSAMFVDALVARLKSKLAVPVKGSHQVATEALKEFYMILQVASANEAKQSYLAKPSFSRYVDARR